MNEKALFSLSYGLFVASAKYEEKDNACIINTAMQVTNTPNQISIAINKGNYTTELIKKSGKFNISVLSEKTPFSVFERFGFQCGKDADKFLNYEHIKRADNGIYYVTEETNAYFSCTVVNEVDLGTHILFTATLDEAEVLSDIPSMTYAYYFANVKPKKEAPKSDGRVWVCKICGYTYDESIEKVKFEDLPNDWVCPLCKHPKSDFELA
jgi:flavin reductase (DIM6/NTAB) family NADH-FMN oxidoreductase RutF